MEYTNKPLCLQEPLSALYEKLYDQIKADPIAPDERFSSYREIGFLADPLHWYEALALCEYAIDSECDAETTDQFFEWIFKGFDCNASVDLNDADYDWFWHKIHGIFDKFSPRVPDVLVEKALQYFSARREYVDKEKTLLYLNQAMQNGSEAARTILGYYYYLGMLGNTDKERGLALMNSAVSDRDKARVAIYKGYIAIAEGRKEEAETLLASLDPLLSDPFVNRLAIEQRAYLLEGAGQADEAAVWYEKVLNMIPSGFAMTRLGYLHYGRKLTDSDPRKGLEWMEKGFRYGRPDVAESLYYCYFESGESWQDDATAIAWLKKGFEYNNEACAYHLAHLYLFNESYQDTEQGLYYLDWAIRMEYTDAYITKAYLYNEGTLVEKDPLKTKELLEKAFARGSAEAAYRLGGVYNNGDLDDDGNPDYVRALEWYKEAAKMGHLYACEYVGRYYLVGVCGEPDPAQAKRWYEKGVELGSPYCMVELAVMYNEGNGVEEDLEKSFRYIKQAAETGYAPGQYLLGRCYKYAIGTEENPDEAIANLCKAVEQNHAKAKAELALSYETGYGVEQDLVKAFDYMKQAAEEIPYAQYRLGYYYMYGLEHQPVDYAEALKWLTLAAENEQPYALLELGDYYLYDYENKDEQSKAYSYYMKAAEQECVNEGLGICLEYGYGVEVNEGEAFKYYLKAAEDGYLRAMFRTGACYYYGTGVKENKNEAFRWFNEAAGSDEIGSVYYKGKMRLDGEGCAQDMEEGIALLRQAAENEHKYAQFDLANCYLAGKGVEEDPDLAMEWFERAADNGHEEALKVTGRRRRR